MYNLYILVLVIIIIVIIILLRRRSDKEKERYFVRNAIRGSIQSPSYNCPYC